LHPVRVIGGAGLCGEPRGQEGTGIPAPLRPPRPGRPGSGPGPGPTPLWPSAGSLDLRGHDGGVARLDPARGFRPTKARPHGALRQPGVGISVRTAGKAQLPSGPAWLASPTSTNCTRWTAFHHDPLEPGQIERPGDRLDAHRVPPGQRPVRPTEAPGLGSVCVSFTPVRHRSPAVGPHASGQVTDGGDRR
jgi:hypothetical protein